MPNVQIPLAGPTYISRSKPSANQLTRNFYLDADQNSENVALIPFPGLKLFSDVSTDLCRGIGIFRNELYAVVGNKFYNINSNGVKTEIGIIDRVNRCKLEESIEKLVITTGGNKPYFYDGARLSLGTNSNLSNSNSATYIKNRVAYDGSGSFVILSDLGDASSVQSANIFSSDNKPDDTLFVIAYRDQLIVFSSESVTPYYNRPESSPPYSIIQNGSQDVGLAATYSVASNNLGVYFLGSDLIPYRLSGVASTPIGDQSFGQAISSYLSVSDAYGLCFTFENKYFYMLTFPGNATWLYTEGLGWTNLAYQFNGSPHLIQDYAYCYNKHLVSDRLTGKIYELDFNTYDDNGEEIDRMRQTRKISGKDFGAAGKEIYMSRLELVVETGVGLATGQGSDPRVMMSFSDDGGRTWSEEQWANIGNSGKFTYGDNPSWTDLGSFYERQFRFRVSDPIKIVLISANAEITIGV